ncbi:MAG: HNH endonuclease [Steroidobacteraceae bacterium]
MNPILQMSHNDTRTHDMAMQFRRASAEAFFARARSRNSALFDRLMRRITRGSSIECWPSKGATSTQPYGVIKVGQRGRRAHRVMFELCYGSIAPGMSIMHTCDNPPCCNPSHLREATHHENMLDRARKHRGGDRHGEKNGRAKLTIEQVRVIRASGESLSVLAKRYGVTTTTISFIKIGTLWSNVK